MCLTQERTLDKKFKIRREALQGMAQLYKQYNVASLNENGESVTENVTENENTNSSLRMLNWIKNKCLHNYYQTQLDDRLAYYLFAFIQLETYFIFYLNVKIFEILIKYLIITADY